MMRIPTPIEPDPPKAIPVTEKTGRFCPTSLADWLELCRKAGVPHIPAERIATVRRLDWLNFDQDEPKERLNAVIREVDEKRMTCMTHYQSTTSKRTRTIVQLLIMAMTATVIVAITACQGEQPPPTSRPQRVDPSPMQTIEAMALQMAALQTKVVESGETAGDDREERVEPSATAIWPATEEPSAAPTPAKAVIPTPSSHDICGRSPTVQKEILTTLRSPSCSIINEAELFRI